MADFTYWKAPESPYAGQASRLVQSLIGIQERKQQKAIQEAYLKVAQEREQKAREQENFNRQLKLFEIAKQTAAQKETPMEPPATASPEEQAYMAGAGMPANVDVGEMPPDEQAQQIAAANIPAPMPNQPAVGFEQPTFDIPGLGSVPLQTRTDIQNQQAQDFVRKLVEASQLERAKGLATGTEMTPEMIAAMDERIRPFFRPGMVVQPPPMGSALAQLSRPEHPEVQGVSGGYLTFGQGGLPQFHRTAEPAGSTTGSWVTDISQPNKPRVWVTAEQLASAPPGTFSDVKPIPTKIDTKRLAMARAALGGPTVKDSLWQLATTINTETRAVPGATTGFARETIYNTIPRLSSYTDPSAYKYLSQIRGFASAIAKAFGEAGMLTNQDIERAVGLFPRLGESPDTTADKLANIQRVMESDPASMFQSIFGREPRGVGETAGGGPRVLSITPLESQ